jgi:hypothetical protein
MADTPTRSVRALIISPAGEVELRDLDSTADNLAATVGGLLEIIYPGQGGDVEGWHAYVDQDGRAKGRATNPAATLLARLAGWYGMDIRDRLHGPVVFLGEHDTGEDDVPAELVELARQLPRAPRSQLDPSRD